MAQDYRYIPLPASAPPGGYRATAARREQARLQRAREAAWRRESEGLGMPVPASRNRPVGPVRDPRSEAERLDAVLAEQARLSRQTPTDRLIGEATRRHAPYPSAPTTLAQIGAAPEETRPVNRRFLDAMSALVDDPSKYEVGGGVPARGSVEPLAALAFDVMQVPLAASTAALFRGGTPQQRVSGAVSHVNDVLRGTVEPDAPSAWLNEGVDDTGWGRTAAGLGLDIGFDPLTYSSLGTSIPFALATGVGKKLAKEAVTAGAGGVIKKMSLVHPGAFRQNKLSVPTYERIAGLLDRIGNPEGTTLDFGSGTGSGADVLRSRGGIVETLEPFPAANATPPTFTVPTDIPDDTYDKIVANDVLSGLSPRYRKEALQDIADKLAYGGVAVISMGKKPAGMSRAAYNAGRELSEAGGRVFADGSYHKEMTTPELMESVKDELGKGYSVEPAAGIGGAAVVLRRGPAPVIDTVKKAKDAANRAAEKIRINALVANSPVEYDDAGQLIVSNRILTAKNAPTPAAGSALMTNMDVVMQDLNLAKKMADLIRSYPQIKSAMRGLSDRGVLQAMTEMGAENLTWLWNKLPKEYRDISRNWYVGANKLSRSIAKEAQLSIDQSSALLAVLSPTKDWNQNVELGKIVGRRWRAYQSSDDVFTPAMMDEYFKNSKQSLDASLKTRSRDVTPRGAAAARDSLQENLRLDSAQYLNKKWSDLDLRGKARMMRAHSSLADPQVYNIYAPTGDVSMVAKTGIGTEDEKLSSLVWQSYPILEKALSVLDDGSVRNISRQLGREHKVRAFFNNINAPSYAGASTADTHQVGASLIMPVGTKSPEVKATMGGMGSASTGVSGINPLWQESLTLAAMNAGANPRDIIPREMQSVSWDAIKALFSPAQKRDTSPTGLPAQARRLWLEHQRGLLTADQVREEIYMLATGGKPLKPGWVTGIQDLEDEGF